MFNLLQVCQIWNLLQPSYRLKLPRVWTNWLIFRHLLLRLFLKILWKKFKMFNLLQVYQIWKLCQIWKFLQPSYCLRLLTASSNWLNWHAQLFTLKNHKMKWSQKLKCLNRIGRKQIKDYRYSKELKKFKF